MRDESALLELGRALLAEKYRFVALTPQTHQRVLARKSRSIDLRDVFGWNRPFTEGDAPAPLLRLAFDAGVISRVEGGLRATVRFASLGSRLFVHSAFPTDQTDSVFFGPDTYRFCAFVSRSLGRCERVVDVGCGSGAGGIALWPRARQIVLADINAAALVFARVNATLAGIPVELVQSDVLAGVTGSVDAVIANPPYMRDPLGRTYRDGGGALGEGLAVRIVRQALERLRPGGRLLLYTGSAVVDGRDTVRDLVEPLCRGRHSVFEYEELDPDVFGEQLEAPGYEDVERIAAIGLSVVVT